MEHCSTEFLSMSDFRQAGRRLSSVEDAYADNRLLATFPSALRKALDGRLKSD